MPTWRRWTSRSRFSSRPTRFSWRRRRETSRLWSDATGASWRRRVRSRPPFRRSGPSERPPTWTPENWDPSEVDERPAVVIDDDHDRKALWSLGGALLQQVRDDGVDVDVVAFPADRDGLLGLA